MKMACREEVNKMNEKYIELEIPNEWGEYLYNLLNGLEKERELHWMINYSEILEKKGNDFPLLPLKKTGHTAGRPGTGGRCIAGTR